MISLDDAWKETPGIDPLTYERHNHPEVQGSEAASQDLHRKKERDVGDRDERELEEKEWIAQQKRQKEERRQREQEAWEREQRELRELERLERDERERDKRDREERERNDRKQMEITLEEEDIEDAAELDNGKHKTGKTGSTEPDIDPIMLQYMEMIRKKKEEEKTVIDT